MAKGIVRERLNIYYLLDTSVSMKGAKIQQLNIYMKELKSALEEAAINENIEILIRVIEFGNGSTARWHIGGARKGVLIEDLHWIDLQANGSTTPTSIALNMVADALELEYYRGFLPVIILITGGRCTEGETAYKAACSALVNKGTIRIAVNYGDNNMIELREFASCFSKKYQKNTIWEL